MRYGSESELRTRGSEERCSAGDLLLEEAVETVLLALLCNDGAEDLDQGSLLTSILGPDGLCQWEDSENDVGEGLSKSNGIVKGGDWEVVLAWLDRGCLCIGEDGVSAICVDLLLGNDSSQGVLDVIGVSILISSNTRCDVGKQFSEESRLKELVGSNDLQCLDTRGLDRCGKSTVGQSTSCKLVDCLERSGVEIREAISEREREWCCSSKLGSCRCESNGRETHVYDRGISSKV